MADKIIGIFKGAAAVSAAAFLCAACVSCGGRETPARKAAERGILLMGNAADPASLDPALSTGLSEFKILSGLFEGLVGADSRTLRPIPAVAKTWKISGDGKKYTFYLDESAKWSDGSQVVAGDFVFAWRRVVNPRLGAEYASLMFPIKNARAINSGEISDLSALGVRAVSDRVLEVELEEPTPYFLSLLYHNVYFPVSKKNLEKFNAAQTRDSLWTRPKNMVCNGAFTLDYWSINEKVSVRKNPAYRDAKNIFLNGVDYLPISNINTEDRAFRAGQLHITDSIAPSRIDAVKRGSPETLRRDDWLGVYYYMFNTRKPPFDDVRVRRAFAMSVDRRLIIDSFLKAGQKSAYSFVPDNCDGYILEKSRKIKFDVSAARKLLAEAGYPGGKGFPRVRLTYNTSEQHKPIAEAVQQMWKKNLGVEVELYNLSWPAYLAARREGDFEIARSSWVGDFAAPESFLQNFESASGLNHTGFSDARYDSLLRAAALSKERSQRLENLADAEALMLESAPIVPLYFYARVYRISPMVENWTSNLLDYHDYKGVRLNPEAEK